MTRERKAGRYPASAALLLGGAFRVSLVGGCAGDLGVLLGLRSVLIALHVVVLAVMVRGGAMRLGCALVVIGGF